MTKRKRRVVQSAIGRLAQGRTVLLISHVPETLQYAQRAVLLDAGRVVAAGTPDELRGSQPLYRTLICAT